ncbi:MAG: efflux RND transporter permease subunit [Candidatus Omnitrophica bacterium]|nr:efflux RND transporter permease subunit [Candidatus Omnitrophota bacterium]
MIISELTVKRPYATLMAFIGILFLGIIAMVKLPVTLLPDIEMPAVTVLIPYPGASASDVENDVTKQLEESLSTVPNLDELSSVSRDNLSVVTCKFDWGADLDVASSDIRNNLDLVKGEIKKNAPDTEEPIIFKLATDMIPVLVVSVSAEESWRDLDYIVDRDITNHLQRTQGVGNISTYGGLKRQVQVILDWGKIKAYNIPPALVIQRLGEENIDMPLGRIKEGRRNYFLRMPGRFRKAEDIEKILLTLHNGRPVYLGDVAGVRDTFAEETSKSYQEGRESIVLVVQKQSGENTIAVARAIRKSLEEIKPFLPPDVKIDIPFDTSDFIVMTMQNLRTTSFAAGLIVILISFLFLRRWKESLIVFLAIPFSLMVAFIFLYARGLTINVISLMSLAMAIGMVVDNTIVVIENISRHIEEGSDPFTASVAAVKEVGGAITASTLTTVVVFIPLVFATGITGIMFKQLGSIVAVTIFASLFVALTLTPMLTSRLLKKPVNEKGERQKESRFYKTGEDLLARMENGYKGFLGFCLTHKARILIPLLFVFVFSLFLSRLVPTEFFPSSDTGELEIKFSLNESARLEEADRIMREIGGIVDEKEPDRLFWYGTVGETAGGMGALTGGSDGPNMGEIRAKFPPKRQRARSINDIASILREEIGRIPGIEQFSVAVTGGMGGGMEQGKQIEVELTGQDLDRLLAFAREVEGVMKGVEGAVDVGISFKEPRMEIHVEVDREKAKHMGVTTGMLGQTLRSYFYGVEATRFRDGDEDFEVFVQMSRKDRYDVGRVGEIPVPAAQGRTIMLKDIASVNLETGPVQIDRKNRQRIITAGCDIYKRAMSQVQGDIEAGMKNLDVPAGVRIETGGEVREQREAFAEMAFLLLLGVLFIYMVMTGQFESLKTPFIIFFAIPFAFIGVIWAVLITGSTFSIMSFMAVIMLIGVVVNNAIVLVDYTNLLRSRGMKVYDAVVNAGSRRLRPVLITLLTTSFGMLPLALGMGTGGEMWQAFGITAMGGLLLSGLVTLFFVPIVYSVIHRD